jgi:uncharacterized UPF0160 family protein
MSTISENMTHNEDGKRLCKRIGTHNGKFHCDEALACFILKQLPDYKNSEIIRYPGWNGLKE